MNADEHSPPANQSIHSLHLNTRHYLSLLFIAIFGTYYYSITHGDFIHLDDITLITRIMNEPSFVLKNLFFPHNVTSYYRPMIELSYRLDYLLWFDSASFWHLTNLTLHAMNTGLVYLVGLVLFRNLTVEKRLAAFCSALLYGLNPLSTEAVCWVSGRSELIVSFFMVSSFLFYILFRRDGVYASLLIAGLLYWCAAMTKETALILPVLLVAYELFLQQTFPVEERGKVYKATAIYFLLTAAYFLLFRRAGVDTASMHVGVGTHGLKAASYFENVLVFFASLGYYTRKLLFPFPLNFAIDSINLVFYGVLGLSVLVFFALCWRFLPLIYRFFTAWILLAVSPAVVAAVLHLPWTPWAERYLYVPLIGFSMALGLCFTLLKKERALAAICIFVLLTGLFWATTLQRTYVWANEAQLWEDTARKSDYGPVHHFYGKSLLASNREAEGIEQMKKAIASGYSYYPYLDLSLFARDKGDFVESERWLRKALQDYPHHPELHMSLAELYLKRTAGEVEGGEFLLKAINEYREYVKVRDNDAAVYLKIGQIYMTAHEDSHAMPFLEKAIKIDKTSPIARTAIKCIQKIQKGEIVQ